jgi:hypothetical protein
MECISRKQLWTESHNLNIEVYPKCVIVKVNMPNDLFNDLVLRLGPGQIKAERTAIYLFAKEIFSLQYDRIKFFAGEIEYDNAMNEYEIERDYNYWFKAVMFPIDYDNFEQDLDTHISYIKKCSTEFNKKSLPGMTKIAERILAKL